MHVIRKYQSLCNANIRRRGIEQLLSTMSAHTHAAALQEQACVCLSELAHKNTSYCTKIAEEGGIGRVLAAMTTHPKVAAVQEQACCHTACCLTCHMYDMPL